jgi:glycosyltransferase involved in cell wall biosynthesis
MIFAPALNTNTLKIAVNTRFLLPGQLEGFGWYTHEIVSRMVKNHPEDQFFFFFDRPYDSSFVYGQNVTPMVLFPPARHPFLFDWWFEWSVPRALKRCGADVFFSPDSMCSLRADIPTVMTCHDLVPLHFPEQVERRHRAYLQRKLPLWFERANHLLTVSEFVKNDMVTTCGIAPEKITAVYNGYRDAFLPLSAAQIGEVRSRYSSGQPYFFYAGAIHPRKNIHRLIEAFDQFRLVTGARCKLLLAGRFAWQTGEIRQAWENARFRDDIVFPGYVGVEELPLLTGAAIASTYVSLSEGFGLPLAEAMACDVPVITSEASCLPEVAGGAALLVNPFDTASITEGLKNIYASEELRNSLVARGRVRRKEFSWEKAAEVVWEVVCMVDRV